MLDNLLFFSKEVSRVTLGTGIEGKLGVQAHTDKCQGIWRDLTDNVNTMSNALTEQVRAIAEVTKAVNFRILFRLLISQVARGDLSKKIEVDVKGEILELKNTINTMVDQLGNFAAEVSRVALEVGTQGILGGKKKFSCVVN
jgi:methyl-accepting chemotaxis protein